VATPEHNVVVVACGNNAKLLNPPEERRRAPGCWRLARESQPDALARQRKQSYVAVAAPGNEVAFSGWTAGISGRYGTSSSAAFVSGERRWSGPVPVDALVSGGAADHQHRAAGGSPVPNDNFGYGIVRIAGAVNASKYDVSADAPNPVYEAFKIWLAGQPGSQVHIVCPEEPALGPRFAGRGGAFVVRRYGRGWPQCSRRSS